MLFGGMSCIHKQRMLCLSLELTTSNWCHQFLSRMKQLIQEDLTTIQCRKENYLKCSDSARSGKEELLKPLMLTLNRLPYGEPDKC